MRRAFCFLVLIGIVLCQLPATLSYQGKLTTATGVGLNGDYNLEFRLYNVEEEGEAMWSEGHSPVSIDKGLFSVILGSDTPLELPFDEQYWLEIVIDGDVMLPRQRLTAEPYAFRAVVADSAIAVHWDGIHGAPTEFGGDDWGEQVVITDATLDGDGTEGLPLSIARQSASEGQVLKWSGGTWAPADEAGEGSSVWSSDGDDVYRTVGSVGIGTDSPSHKLDVKGSAEIQRLVLTPDISDTEIESSVGMMKTVGSGSTFAGFIHDGICWRKFYPTPDSITCYGTGYPLSVTASSDTTICDDESLELTAIASGGTLPYEYDWDGSGDFLDGASYTISPEIGVHTYTVQVRDAEMDIVSDDVTVTVLECLSVVAEPDTTICAGDEVELRATASGGVPPYQYDWDGSGDFLGAATHTVSPEIGVHIYTVQVRDAEMTVVSDDVTVTVEECLSVVAEPDTTICDGDEVVLRATASGGTPPYEYDWDGSGDFLGAATHTVSPDIGVHTYTLEVRDAEMTVVSDNVTVTVTGCPCPGMPTVTDHGGNVYNTVLIGDQCWMAENLKTTHYSDGTEIPLVTDNSDWQGLDTGAYCEYDNDPGNVAIYGRLYNWYAVDDARGLCPTAWSVPSDEELTTLTSYLGSAAGSKLAGDYDLWRDGNLRNNVAFGTSGFTALPGGYRGNDGYYHYMSSFNYFWSSSENSSANAWGRYLHYNDSVVYPYIIGNRYGISVRCLRDVLSAIAGPDTTICDGDEVELRATASGGVPPYQYDWDGSGDFLGGATYTVSPAIRIHTYTVAVRDAEMTVVSDDLTVTVVGCPCPGMPTVNDYDGNVYNTVLIGTQCWMTENLTTTNYHDGTPIPYVTDHSEWEGLSTGAYCEYDNDPDNVATYGRLYNWYAVDDARGLCPIGWSVASDDDWITLEMYLGMSEAQANETSYRGTDQGSLLAGGFDLWPDGDLKYHPVFNISGFTALPGGYRESSGFYFNMPSHAYFWTSSEGSSTSAGYRSLYYIFTDIRRWGSDKSSGISVRCMKY